MKPSAVLGRTLLSRLVLGAALGLCVSCGRGAAPAGPAVSTEVPRLPTTDGDIATHNFQAELAQAERQHRERPGDLARTRALVDLLLAQARFFGRLARYDDCEALVAEAVARAPRSGDAHLLRARLWATLHRFGPALAELDRAERLNANTLGSRQLRVSIWQATGHIDQALVLLRGWRREHPDLAAYGAEAGALADQRNLPAAAAAFSEARRHYADVSPFPVAWLEFQEGHMWESAGRSDRARPLFESALARLPGYAAAAAHLARLRAAFGDPAGQRQAAALLEPLTAVSDDPEYLGQLGALYRKMGRSAEGDRLVRRAAAGYQALLARHPEAFFDHAARFWLQVGGDPERARELARQNLEGRPTADARDLLAETERAVAARALPVAAVLGPAGR